MNLTGDSTAVKEEQTDKNLSARSKYVQQNGKEPWQLRFSLARYATA